MLIVGRGCTETANNARRAGADAGHRVRGHQCRRPRVLDILRKEALPRRCLSCLLHCDSSIIFFAHFSLRCIHQLLVMYVHYPEPGADLVPLPEFEGSKLEPFIFQRKWMVEILEGLGSGMHSWVFKVRIDGQIYAPKLVCPAPRIAFRHYIDHVAVLLHRRGLPAQLSAPPLEKGLLQGGGDSRRSPDHASTWYFNCSPKKTDKIKNDAWSGFRLRWRLKDGMLYAECFGPEKE